MILDTTGSGPLGLAIRQAIRAKGEEVRLAAVGEPSDLFMAALDRRALVCTAASSLLDGKLDPTPSPERLKTIVRAANAPGSCSRRAVRGPLTSRKSRSSRRTGSPT
jgi:hypothetical protein